MRPHDPVMLTSEAMASASIFYMAVCSLESARRLLREAIILKNEDAILLAQTKVIDASMELNYATDLLINDVMHTVYPGIWKQRIVVKV